MKNLILITLSVLLFSSCNRQPAAISYDRTKVINELIGDESYLAIHGKLPDASTPEQDRIKAHLAYAEQLLRAKKTNGLSVQERNKRKQILDLLHEYMLAGNFPKNYDIQGERRPCFLDRDGNICAVGYLVEQTEGIALACKINSEYKYNWVSDMDMPQLNDWIAQSGLTKDEFSLIQPSYGNDDLSPIGVPLAGLSIPLTIINTKQTFKGRNNNTAPIMGLSIGAVSAGFGAFLVSSDGGMTSGFFGGLCVLSGTTSILSSSSNLIFGKKRFALVDKLSLNSTAFITPGKKYIPGLTLTYKL